MIRYYLNSKIFDLLKIFFVYLFFCFQSYADDTSIKNQHVVLGENTAPVKIKIFSSFTCPHCANFHFEIIPDVKKNYIDSGKVQLIFIDFPLDQAAFNASKLLHCVKKNKQISFMDKIYKNQNQWTSGSTLDEINKNLKKIAESLGISQVEFDKCLIDEAISDKILNGRIVADQKYSIKSTPTIIINEKKLEGSVTFESIKKEIEKFI